MSTVCRTVLEEALGRPVTDKEADRLFKRIDRRSAQLRQANPAMGYNDSLLAVEREFAEAAELRDILAKRNAMLNAQRKLESVDYIKGTWADKPGEGLKSILVGTQSGRRGSRASIGAAQQAAEDQYLGGLIADISAVEGGLDAYTRGDIDADVAEALWRISHEQDLKGVPDQAQGVARAINKWQEYGRKAATDAGAWIGKVPGYITSTFHDAGRISKSVDDWLASAQENFDIGRMAEEMEVDPKEMGGILRNIWQGLASGVHLKTSVPKINRKGLQSVGKKLSHERVIHFKDSQSWQRYNTDFGAGTLHEAVAAGLTRQAKATALMNTLGPNYENVYDGIVTETLERMTKEKADPKEVRAFKSDAASYKRLYLAELDGSLNIPGSDPVATVASSIRAVQGMASLGGSTLSSVTDLGTIGLSAKYNGIGALEATSKAIGNLGRSMPDAEKLGLYADLGVVLSSLSGKLSAGRFNPEDRLAGSIGRLQQKFFTLNLQNRWTDTLRESVAELLSANLSRRAGDSFDGLPPQLQTTLAQYGIDPDKWDIFRKTEATEIDGSRFMSPKALEALPDEDFAAYLTKRDLSPTKARIRDLRREIGNQFRQYFSDQNAYSVLMPDAATRGLLKAGTQSGTILGEVVRFIMQFKSFPVAYGQRIIGREFRQGGKMGVAQMIAVTTLYGYAAMNLKDLAKGKVPRDPSDYRTWIASLQQGGGLGLYGDLLFSQVLDRRFGDATAQLLGPTISDVLGSSGIAGLLARGAQGQDVGAATTRFVTSNTPFLNLFYVRLLLDYGFLYHLQEWMNPGSLGRMEQEMQQRTGQEFIAPPSEVVQ